MSDALNLTPDELLTTTRSVRKRLDLTREVDLDVVRECLELALQAPSGSNTQGWHWLVIADPEKRARIAEYYQQAFAGYRASAGYPANRTYDTVEHTETQHKVADSAAYLSEHLAEVPVHIIGAIKASENLPAANQAGLWGSLLPGAWSLQLALRSRGLGSAWTSMHLQFEKEISELLGIPPNIRQGVLLPVAYYTGETFKPAKRQPLDEVLHVDGW